MTVFWKQREYSEFFIGEHTSSAVFAGRANPSDFTIYVVVFPVGEPTEWELFVAVSRVLLDSLRWGQ